MRHCVHVKVGGQLVGLNSLLPPCGAWGLNSGRQTERQVLLPMRHPTSPLSYFADEMSQRFGETGWPVIPSVGTTSVWC